MAGLVRLQLTVFFPSTENFQSLPKTAAAASFFSPGSRLDITFFSVYKEEGHYK